MRTNVRASLCAAIITSVVAAVALASPSLASPPRQAQVDLSRFFNVDCISAPHVLVDGNCDGQLQSYVDDQKLPAAGPFTTEGVTFTFPARPTAASNAVSPTGQVIPLPGKPGQRFLHVLVSAVNAGSSKRGGPMTITYADKSTSTVPLMAYDWATNEVRAVVTANGQGPYSQPESPAFNLNVNMFLETLALAPGKVPVSITLPGVAGNVVTGGDSPSNGLRIFAMTLSATPAAPAHSGPVFK